MDKDQLYPRTGDFSSACSIISRKIKLLEETLHLKYVVLQRSIPSCNGSWRLCKESDFSVGKAAFAYILLSHFMTFKK